MSNSLRGVFRLLGVLAVLALIQPLPTSVVADATKEFPLCIQACNDARKACNNQCLDDCHALFPDSGTQEAERVACVDACKAICLAQSDDCKRICEENRDGETPPEP